MPAADPLCERSAGTDRGWPANSEARAPRILPTDLVAHADAIGTAVDIVLALDAGSIGRFSHETVKPLVGQVVGIDRDGERLLQIIVQRRIQDAVGADIT